LGPPKKRVLGFKPCCEPGETPEGPLQMSLTLELPTACPVGSAVVLPIFFQKPYESRHLVTNIGK